MAADITSRRPRASLGAALAVRATPQPRAGGLLPARLRSDRAQRGLLVLAAVVALVAVAAAQGLLPGMIAGATISYWSEIVAPAIMPGRRPWAAAKIGRAHV